MHFHLIIFSGFFFVSTVPSGTIFGDTLKVDVHARHFELKELLASHHKFNWNNWLHLSSLLILRFLIGLLLLAYCFIKIKIWSSLTRSFAPSSAHLPVIEKPYVINLRNLHQPVPRADVPAQDE